MIGLLAVLVLAPSPSPDPAVPDYPTYITQGDGTRVTCTPSGSYCWQYTEGLPSYLAD